MLDASRYWRREKKQIAVDEGSLWEGNDWGELKPRAKRSPEKRQKVQFWLEANVMPESRRDIA